MTEKVKDTLGPEIMRGAFKNIGYKDDLIKTNAVKILNQSGLVDVRSL